MIEITYVNKQGHIGKCVLTNPDNIDHSWWSHNKGIDGKFIKHDISSFSAFLCKLSGKFSIKQLKDD